MQKHLLRLHGVHGEKLRYLVVGVFNTAFGYVLFLAMLALLQYGLDGVTAAEATTPAILASNYYLVAQWTAWVISVPVGTWTMKTLVFRSKGRLPREIGRAYLVYLPTVALSSVILWFCVSILGLPPAFAQLIAIAVAVVFGYVGHKYFTFRAEHRRFRS